MSKTYKPRKNTAGTAILDYIRKSNKPVDAKCIAKGVNLHVDQVRRISMVLCRREYYNVARKKHYTLNERCPRYFYYSKDKEEQFYSKQDAPPVVTQRYDNVDITKHGAKTKVILDFIKCSNQPIHKGNINKNLSIGFNTVSAIVDLLYKNEKVARKKIEGRWAYYVPDQNQ